MTPPTRNSCARRGSRARASRSRCRTSPVCRFAKSTGHCANRLWPGVDIRAIRAAIARLAGRIVEQLRWSSPILRHASGWPRSGQRLRADLTAFRPSGTATGFAHHSGDHAGELQRYASAARPAACRLDSRLRPGRRRCSGSAPVSVVRRPASPRWHRPRLCGVDYRHAPRRRDGMALLGLHLIDPVYSAPVLARLVDTLDWCRRRLPVQFPDLPQWEAAERPDGRKGVSRQSRIVMRTGRCA